MIAKIKQFIDEAFVSVEQTQKIQELKDELFSNLVEKYTDSIKEGKTEAEAYAYATSTLGDIRELVDGSAPVKTPYKGDGEGKRLRFAGLLAAGIMLCCVSPFTVLPFLPSGNVLTGAFVMFICIGFAVGLIVFAVMTKPRYSKKDETLVEEFKEWRRDNDKKKSAYRSFSGAFWALITALYLIISFIFDIWEFSWVLFIIGVAIQNIIKGIIELKGVNHE